jgi:hypothetical protein
MLRPRGGVIVHVDITRFLVWSAPNNYDCLLSTILERCNQALIQLKYHPLATDRIVCRIDISPGYSGFMYKTALIIW